MSMALSSPQDARQLSSWGSTTTAGSHSRQQTWASATWATGQSLISGMLHHSRDSHDLTKQKQHQQHGQYLQSSFRRTGLPGGGQKQSQAHLPSLLPPLPTPPSSHASPDSTLSIKSPGPSLAGSRRQPLELPPIPRLLGIENLDEWDDILIRTLRLHGLAEYITLPYPGVRPPSRPPQRQPEHALGAFTTRSHLFAPQQAQHHHGGGRALTHEQWESNRAAVCLLILGSISSDVRDTLLASGYDATCESNPKALHDLLLEALPRAAGESLPTWMAELGSISPAEERFGGSLREFCLRLAYLRRRLHQAEPQPNDNLVLVMAVLGLGRCGRYTGLSMALGKELEGGGLSWARLMGDLAGLHGREVAERRRRRRDTGTTSTGEDFT